VLAADAQCIFRAKSVNDADGSGALITGIQGAVLERRELARRPRNNHANREVAAGRGPLSCGMDAMEEAPE